MSSRYSPQDFQHNGRVALALVPCLITTCIVGGQSVTTVLALGSIIGYVLDLFAYREGAYAASWLTLCTTACAFSISTLSTSDSPLLIQICLLFAVILALALTGMWTSLQFRYFQLQHPAVALAFERFLLAGSVPAAAMLGTLGLSMFVDASDLPYYLAVGLCTLYANLAQPLTSSFATPGGAARGGASAATTNGARRDAKAAALALSGPVQGRGDSALLALLTVVLPPAVYMAVHWVLLTRHVMHIYSLLLLGGGPAMLLCLLPNGLWWLPGAAHGGGILRGIIMTLSFAALLAGFEGRVVFHSFGQYILLPPPWGWVAVTFGLGGTAGVGLAHHLGLLGSTVDVTLAGCGLLLCTTAGSLAAGVPFQWLVAPLVAASGLALFFDSKSLREYTMFVGGAFFTGVWFVQQHFWFLDIHVGGMSLQAVCKLALAALVPALMVPGLVHARASPIALDALVMLQASLLCVLEEKMFVPSHSDFAGEPMYPGYLVVATSAVGLLAVRRLAATGNLTAMGEWVGHALYVSKVVMLVLPEAYLVLPSVLLCLAASAPIFLTPAASSAAGGMTAGARRRRRVPPWVGLLHLITILVALGLARFAVFDIVQWVLASRPPEGLLLGALLLVGAAALAPLVFTCYQGQTGPQRALACLVLSGLLLALLQPPLLMQGGSRCPHLPLALCPRLWDERHVPLHDLEDAEVWALGLARRDHWPRWLLIAALVLGAASGAVGGPSSAATASRGTRGAVNGGNGAALARVLVAGVGGALVGSYVALEVVPQQAVLQVLVLVSCVLIVAFVFLLPVPALRGPLVLPGLLGAWAACVGLIMLLQANIPLPKPPLEMRRLFPDKSLQLDVELHAALRAALLAVFAVHAALVALALKLRVGSTLRQQDARLAAGDPDGELMDQNRVNGSHSASDMFCGMVPLAVYSRWGKSLRFEASPYGAMLQRLGQEGLTWAPSAGNVMALAAFFMVVVLNNQITGGSPEALFMAAPLLLLLQQDPIVFPGLTEARRYCPPVAALAASLLLSCITDATGVAMGLTSWGQVVAPSGTRTALLPLLTRGSPWSVAVQQIVLAVCAAPGSVLVVKGLWAVQSLGMGQRLIAGALTLLPLLLSAQPAAQYLALVVLVGGVAQHAQVRQTKKAGARVI